jgi:hypothetical protein
MLESLGMSIKKRTILAEPIAKKRESKSITTREIRDSLRVDLESK